ncbi:MAG: PEP-CTERM sorting domain-containing protein [Candidatus Methylumidiphilus sp.]
MLANLRYSLPLCLALALPWATPATADIIDLANNLSQAGGSNSRVNDILWPAQAFTTDATHTTVTAVTTILKSDSTTTGTLNLYIYSSAANKPNTLVTSIGSYDIASQLTTTFTNYTLSSLNVSLNPSTQYFLVLGGSSSMANGDAWWGFTASTSGQGFPSDNTVSPDSGQSWLDPSQSSPQQMRIQATSSDIPEPASLGLMGAGMVGWFFTRRRTARKKICA